MQVIEIFLNMLKHTLFKFKKFYCLFFCMVLIQCACLPGFYGKFTLFATDFKRKKTIA